MKSAPLPSSNPCAWWRTSSNSPVIRWAAPSIIRQTAMWSGSSRTRTVWNQSSSMGVEGKKYFHMRDSIIPHRIRQSSPEISLPRWKGIHFLWRGYLAHHTIWIHVVLRGVIVEDRTGNGEWSSIYRLFSWVWPCVSIWTPWRKQRVSLPPERIAVTPNVRSENEVNFARHYLRGLPQ